MCLHTPIDQIVAQDQSLVAKVLLEEQYQLPLTHSYAERSQLIVNTRGKWQNSRRTCGDDDGMIANIVSMLYEDKTREFNQLHVSVSHCR
jgi:metal-responsive CopG/Arc/MetJ family transcriptional regulator